MSFFNFAFIFERVLLGTNSGQQIFFFSVNTLKIFLFFFFFVCSVPVKNLMYMYSIFFPLWLILQFSLHH